MLKPSIYVRSYGQRPLQISTKHQTFYTKLAAIAYNEAVFWLNLSKIGNFHNVFHCTFPPAMYDFVQ